MHNINHTWFKKQKLRSGQSNNPNTDDAENKGNGGDWE
jgi:hypothetical protein